MMFRSPLEPPGTTHRTPVSAPYPLRARSTFRHSGIAFARRLKRFGRNSHTFVLRSRVMFRVLSMLSLAAVTAVAFAQTQSPPTAPRAQSPAQDNSQPGELQSSPGIGQSGAAQPGQPGSQNQLQQGSQQRGQQQGQQQQQTGQQQTGQQQKGQ